MGLEQVNNGAEKLSIRDRLIKSGIAQRMFDSMKKHSGAQDPEVTFGIEDCDFKVEQNEYEIPKNSGTMRTETEVIIECPNLKYNPNINGSPKRVREAFGVYPGKRFGATSEEPLTQEQLAEIQGILETNN